MIEGELGECDIREGREKKTQEIGNSSVKCPKHMVGQFEHV
jgi:putative transposon-encoded protein